MSLSCNRVLARGKRTYLLFLMWHMKEGCGATFSTRLEDDCVRLDYCWLHKSVPPSILKITARCAHHQISNEISPCLPHDIDVNIVNTSTQIIL